MVQAVAHACACAAKLAIVSPAGGVDLGNAGVVQPGQDLGLVGEALEQVRRGQVGADDLEGDGPARAVLLRLVNGAHTAFAQHAHHSVAVDDREPRCARRERLRARSGQGAAQE